MIKNGTARQDYVESIQWYWDVTYDSGMTILPERFCRHAESARIGLM